MAASCCARACASASVFVSIYLLLLSASFVSANVRTSTTRLITTTSAPGGLFSEFDADPVNFPASPKMFIEQVMASSKGMVIRVFYSDTQQELISYNISYQLADANEHEREQPLASTHRKLPNEFDLHNLLQETPYNVCVRASFTRGDFALYTMQIEKVRNCSIFSTVGEPSDTSRGGLNAFIGILVYISVTVLIYAVYKLRNRYCRDACKCACLERLLARCNTVAHAKWILIRDFFSTLRPRSQPPAIDGVAQQQSRTAVEAANTYIAVPQNEDSSKRANCNQNHKSTDCVRADSCDPMSRSEVWTDLPRKSQYLSQRSLNDLEASKQLRDGALRSKESVDTSRSEGRLHDADCDALDSTLRGDSRIAPRHNQNVVSRANAPNDTSVCVDENVPLRRISKRSRSPRDSSSAACPNESCKKSNGSSHERRTARNTPSAPKLVIQNATPCKDSEKTSRGTPTPTTTVHSPSLQSPNTGDPKIPLSRAAELQRNDLDEKNTRETYERLTKSSDRHECPQHGSIVLTINPETVVISNKKRKRKERSEQELSPERLDERERFVRSFYEKLYARQRSGTKQIADEPVERDRSRSRRSTAPGSRKPPTPTDTQAQHRSREPNVTKVSYRKQRSMPATGNTNAVPTLTPDTNDVDTLRDNQPAVHQTTRTGGSRRKTTEWSKRALEQPNLAPLEIENRHRKKRAPLDSLDNDQTDDEVWILRASKV